MPRMTRHPWHSRQDPEYIYIPLSSLPWTRETSLNKGIHSLARRLVHGLRDMSFNRVRQAKRFVVMTLAVALLLMVLVMMGVPTGVWVALHVAAAVVILLVAVLVYKGNAQRSRRSWNSLYFPATLREFRRRFPICTTRSMRCPCTAVPTATLPGRAATPSRATSGRRAGDRFVRPPRTCWRSTGSRCVWPTAVHPNVRLPRPPGTSMHHRSRSATDSRSPSPTSALRDGHGTPRRCTSKSMHAPRLAAP